ncbi:very short patch repair endonuclease [Oscillatoria amoena NRMC-F 0135]|nr:very short patch repair endonuclease [Oscillatoria amoena NRMC-F 0135]
MDIFSPEKRTQIMAKIRSSGNKSTELKAVSLFRARRITGWRRKYPLPGKPDFCFPKHKIAVFVDGCFWHGCPKHGRMPSTNKRFWVKKISRNVQRDKLVVRILKKRGWTVVRIWEHEFAKAGTPSRKMNLIERLTSPPGAKNG